MLVLFITLGLVMSIVVGLFFAIIITNDIQNIVKKVLLTIIISLSIGFSISGLMTLEHLGDTKRWNDGHCKHCGNEWHLFDVEKISRSSSSIYYYECDNCNTVIELHSRFEK